MNSKRMLTAFALLAAASGYTSTALAYPGGPATTATVVAGNDEKTYVRNLNDFGLNLMKGIASAQEDKSKNLAISPLSLSQAFYLVGNGAAGATSADFKEKLLVAGEWADLNTTNSRVLKELVESEEVRLSLANSIWLKSDVTLNPAFAPTVEAYQALVKPLNSAIDQAIVEINKWVEDNTEGKIPKLLESLNPETDLVVANAVYFKGDWTTPFDKELTTDGEFLNAKGTSETVRMMSRSGKINYTDGKYYRAVHLPYGEKGDYGMTIILPEEGVPMEVLVNYVSANMFDSLRQSLKSHFSSKQGTVEIPVFKLDSRSNLLTALKEIGLKAVTEASDFSNLSPELKEAMISDAVHQVVVEVDEKGTEAAAATAIGMVRMSAPLQEEEPFHFRVDRPFLFTIEAPNGMILFTGAVNTVSGK